MDFAEGARDLSSISGAALAFFSRLLYNISITVARGLAEINRRRRAKTGKENNMKAVITVTGKDSVGIIAAVSALCTEHNANIVEITQSVLSEYFAMIMLVEIDRLNTPFAAFAETLAAMGRARGLDVRAMHEDIFNTMHHV